MSGGARQGAAAWKLRWDFFRMELSQSVSYRWEFWLNLIVGKSVMVMVPLLIIKAVLETTPGKNLNGLDYTYFLLYYLTIPFLRGAVTGPEYGKISNEIYQGTLTKYLLYPISFFEFRYFANWAHIVLELLTLILVVMIGPSFLPVPWDAFSFFAFFLPSLLMAVSLYFYMGAVMELVAFWLDFTWSLSVMLSFFVSILGGAWLPLRLFPEQIRPVLELLPFSLVISFPMQSLFNELAPLPWLRLMLAQGLWTLFFYAITRWTYARGLKRYAGVGI